MESKLSELVSQKKIQWRPWIGKDYVKHRLLILGESHRFDSKRNSMEKHESPMFTRDCVKQMGVKFDPGTVSFYKNIHKLFSINSQKESEEFWHKVTFMNIIQRPIFQEGTNRKSPSTKDYQDGWIAVNTVIDIVKPKVIICFSSTIGDKINSTKKQYEYKLTSYSWIEKIGRNWTKSGVLENKNGERIKIIFVKHPSKMNNNDFSPWQEFIFKTLPEINNKSHK